MNTIRLNILGEAKAASSGVSIKNQDKSVEIVENGVTEVTADSGYTGLGKVTINANVQGGESQYHEIKPNGWYWKSKEEVDWSNRLMGLETHMALCAIGEGFKDTQYAPLNFTETYVLIGQLTRLSQDEDNFDDFYQRFPNYIQEAIPLKGAMGLPNFNSVQEFYQYQGIDESNFFALMEQYGWVRITEEEYNEAKSKLG